MAVEISLPHGRVAIIDDEDAVIISRFRWTLHKTTVDGLFYAARQEWNGGNPKGIFMHRQIMGNPLGKRVDHIDGDGLNNRRSNLRLTTVSQNAQNRRGAQRNSSTGVRGVWWDKNKRSYTAAVQMGGKFLFRGTFHDLDEAESAVIAARRQFMTHSSECISETPIRR